jgi:hypothetical protein
MCSSPIAAKVKTCLPSPCVRCYRLRGGSLRPQLLRKLRCLVRFSGRWPAIAHCAFRHGQSPVRQSCRYARRRRPVQVVAPDMSGDVSWVEIEERDQPFFYPRESECHHRSHPIQLAPFDPGVQAVQLSPYRACSGEPVCLMESTFPFLTSRFVPLSLSIFGLDVEQFPSPQGTESYLHCNDCPYGRTVGVKNLRSSF